MLITVTFWVHAQEIISIRQNKSHGPCLSPPHEEPAGTNFTAITRQLWMRKQLQPGDEKSPSMSHQPGVEPQAHLSCVQINLFPMRRRSMHPCYYIKRKRQLNFCVSTSRMNTLSVWWRQSIPRAHTMSSARNSASKAYPIASIICQQPWQRSSIRAVVLEAGLFQGRLPAAGLPDLSLS